MAGAFDDWPACSTPRKRRSSGLVLERRGFHDDRGVGDLLLMAVAGERRRRRRLAWRRDCAEAVRRSVSG